MRVWADSSNVSTKIVATSTKKAAMEAMGVSRAHFDQYCGETANRFHILLANLHPGQVYIQPDRGPCDKQWLKLPEGEYAYTYTGGSR